MSVKSIILATPPFEFLAGEPYPDVATLRERGAEDQFALDCIIVHAKQEWMEHLTSLDGIRKSVQRIRGEQ